MKVNPADYLNVDGTHTKFGSLDEKGTIVVPNFLTLKWIPNHFFQLNEKQTVHLLFLITLFFCISSFFVLP